MDRCRARVTTLDKGEQCSRRAVEGEYCHQHSLKMATGAVLKMAQADVRDGVASQRLIDAVDKYEGSG
jgi:hypothetical protein